MYIDFVHQSLLIAYIDEINNDDTGQQPYREW